MKPLDTYQFDLLEDYLKDAGIPYYREDTGCDEYEHHEIYYPNMEVHLCDAIISTGSYGRTEGLLEMMGLLPLSNKGTVEGFLNARTVFERIKAHWDAEGAKRWKKKKN